MIVKKGERRFEEVYNIYSSLQLLRYNKIT